MESIEEVGNNIRLNLTTPFIGCLLSGKSDPFAVFTLNGERVFKSETRKKTLNPEWNEEFTIQVVGWSCRIIRHQRNDIVISSRLESRLTSLLKSLTGIRSKRRRAWARSRLMSQT